MGELESIGWGFAVVYLKRVLRALQLIRLWELGSSLENSVGLRAAVPSVGSEMERSNAAGGY